MGRMVHLLSVHDEFHARLIAARLGSDGILTELRPPLGGPYPLRGEVRVYVGEADLSLARELLLADQADGPPADDASVRAEERASGPSLLGPSLRVALVTFLLVALLLIALNRAG